MNADEVTREVAPLIGSKWGYADDYRIFISPRCPECSRRGCDDLEHLEAVRAGVQRTMGVGEMARVLGVTKPTGGRS